MIINSSEDFSKIGPENSCPILRNYGRVSNS